MNPEVLPSQTPMSQIPELCDIPQVGKEENSIGETCKKHKKMALTNLTAAFMTLKTLPINKLHSVNKYFQHEYWSNFR